MLPVRPIESGLAEVIENHVLQVHRLHRRGALFKFQVRATRASRSRPTIPGWACRFPNRGGGHGRALRLRVPLPARGWAAVFLALVFQAVAGETGRSGIVR